jgi:N-acyl-D-aspartate/D-glutamate deacylase
MFDLAIRGALVLDGSGALPVKEDVAIAGGKIAARAPALPDAPGGPVLDARGLALMPGFVDMHTHYDLALRWPGLSDHLIRQGITTVIGGNCGIGEADVAKVLDEARSARLAVHVGVLASHGPLRSRVVPREEGRAARADEALAIEREVANALDAGALGLSWGPYHANALASKEELVAAARALSSRHKPWVVHRRDEGAKALEATEEAIEVARLAGCPLHVSHLKIAGPLNWGRFDDLLGIVARGRSRQDVTTDVYPYDGSLTYLNAILPGALKADGRLLERLATPAGRAEALEGARRWFVERQPAEKIVLVAPAHPGAPRGGTLADAARDFGVADAAEAALRIIEVDGLGGWATYRDMMKADHVEQALELEGCAIASDAVPEDDGRPAAHPRCYGTFARALARAHARGRLADAVVRATRMPCERFGLDRGTLRVGAPADLVLVDLAKLRDAATYAEPDRYPEGIRHVLVRGVFALRDGEPTGARSGEVLTS